MFIHTVETINGTGGQIFDDENTNLVSYHLQPHTCATIHPYTHTHTLAFRVFLNLSKRCWIAVWRSANKHITRNKRPTISSSPNTPVCSRKRYRARERDGTNSALPRRPLAWVAVSLSSRQRSSCPRETVRIVLWTRVAVQTRLSL